MPQPFVRLDPRVPAVAALLADARALSVWEMLRRFGRAAAVAELAAACALPVSVVQRAIDRATEVGLVERARLRADDRGRQHRYRATGEQILVEVDPSSPADARLMRASFARHVADSRACVDQSLADAARGINGFGLKHAFTHITLDESEAKELLALFAPIDALVARIAEKHDRNPAATPRRCNYHLAFHVAPISVERLPPARVTMASRSVMASQEAQVARAPSRLLSPRELEVAQRLVRGETGPEIAKALGVSRSTVSTLCERLYRKLGITRRAQLAVRMHALGVR
jgi:DNA-binding CsgD family transcriptional regulator